MKFSPARLAVRLAVSLALSAGVALAAHADTVFVPVAPVNGTTQLTGSFNAAVAAGAFSLTLLVEGATEFDQIFTATAGTGITFSGLTVSIPSDEVSGFSPVALSSVSVTPSSITTTAQDQSASFLYYTITGTASVAGTITGTVVDDTNFTPAAQVPEPGTWALMLGGLGLIGAGVSKRRRT